MFRDVELMTLLAAHMTRNLRASRQVHVLNAPSPAATSSLEIAKHIVAQLSDWSS